mmetsp:Transcript_103157/g.290220  ORF Transcript_103157/g.290220 Transcript_103157/m.290220 type:complete len:488 (-) Transcript_103157:44-1507(-)
MFSSRIASFGTVIFTCSCHALMMQQPFIGGAKNDGKSDLSGHDRSVTIYTTAAIPWLTGTAVNPLMRALHLAQNGFNVHLVLPWLADAGQQRELFGNTSFADSKEQEGAVLRWIASQDLPLPERLSFLWYDAAYISAAGGLYPRSLLEALPENHSVDIFIAEEPEHLSTFQTGPCWKSRFPYIVGIVHTNYDYYMEHGGLPMQARKTQHLFWETQLCSNVDLLIRLSNFDALHSPLAGLVPLEIANVNGVSQRFLSIGEGSLGQASTVNGVAAYFIGKALWDKGYEALLALSERDPALHIDAYGSGADAEAIEHAAALRTHGRMAHHPGVSHDDPMLQNYSVLVNPSRSDVLCTVTMEALAMGKRAVIVRDPSNVFFIDNFPDRVFAYDNEDGDSFAAAYVAAVALGPARPLPAEEAELLTWEAATARLLGLVLPAAGAGARPPRPDGKPDLSYCEEPQGMTVGQVHAWQELLWATGNGERLPEVAQ